MIKCSKCGSVNAYGSLFCAECGVQLQQKKSGGSLAVALSIGLVWALLIGGGIFFLVRFIGENEEGDGSALPTEAIAQSETEISGENEPDRKEQEQLKQTEEIENAGVHADVNAVETAVFEMRGTVKTSGGQSYLKLDNPVSVYAYNAQSEPVLLEKVKKFLLESEEDLENYGGSPIIVKGSVLIGEENQPIIQVSQYTSEQPQIEDGAIHRCQVVQKDCTWSEAMEECRRMGGYLARINSYDEYVAIVNQIEHDEGCHGVHFYLGGRREEGQTEYYWVDSDNQLFGAPINGGGSWADHVWMEGEPSYVDGETQEMYMNLFYYDKGMAWVLNDVPEDITVYYPGKTGYICEFEN